MTDVVEIANKRRVRLAVEVATVDEFIRMAEKLVKNSGYDVEEEYDSSPRKRLPTQMHRSDTINY